MHQTIQGFYHRTVQRLDNKRPIESQDGTSYVYCPADEALNDCRLHAIHVYIAKRRLHALTDVEGTFIYEICQHPKHCFGGNKIYPIC